MIHHRLRCLRMSTSAICVFSSVCLLLSLQVRRAVAANGEADPTGRNQSAQQSPPQQTTPAQQPKQPQQQPPPQQQTPPQQTPPQQTPPPPKPPNPLQHLPTP